MKDLFKRLSVLLLCTVLANILSLGAVIMLARAMGPATFGFYSIALAAVTILVIPVSLGLGAAAVRRIASGADAESVLTETAVCGFAAIVLVFLVVSAATSSLRWEVVNALSEVKVYVLGFSAAILSAGVADAYLRGKKDTRRLGFVRVGAAAVNLITAYLCLNWIGADAEVPMIARIAELGLFTVVALWTVRRISPVRLQGIRELLGYGLPSYVSVLALAVFVSADKFIIGELLGYQDLGRFSFAFFLSFTLVSRAADVAMAVLFPEAVQHRDKRGLAARLVSYSAPALLVITPLLVLFMWIVIQVMDGQYQFTIAELLVFSLAGTLFFIAHVHWWFIATISNKAVGGFALFSLLTCVLALCLHLVLMPVFFFQGALIALAISCVFLSAAGYVAVRRVACRKRVVK